MNKKTKISISILTVVIALGAAYYFMMFKPHQEATMAFEKASSKVEAKNKILNKKVKEANTLIDKKEEPLDTKTLDSLKASINEAKKNTRRIPKIKEKTDDIKKQTKALNKPIDYSKEIKSIDDSSLSYTNSVKQLKQITNPTNTFIEERIKTIPTITGVQSVTEANDPNGNLNKQGGYTASVYFTDNQVTADVLGANPVEKGNDAGGNIEVYKTKEEAEKRNTYISAFDGNGLLNPGSHYVYGTLVIRTSRNLTASQQESLTKSIYEKLIELK